MGGLGFFVRGALFPEYESVAFSLNIGDVSDPFKTEVGYHLVLLEDRVGEKIKTFIPQSLLPLRLFPNPVG